MNTNFTHPFWLTSKMITHLSLIFCFLIYNFLLKCRNKSRHNCTKVLHHSENFLVVSKPYDMVINSNNPEVQRSLQIEIRKIFPTLVNPNLCHEFHFVHRLDYATSGVICIALNKRSAQAASLAFEERKARKYYLALVHGHIKESSLIIDQPIGDDTREIHGNRKMCTSSNVYCRKPRNSRTALLVLETGFRDGNPATKILLCPQTGRRHQLRVHCSHIGHVIVGDYTYSNKTDTKPHRTFLHAFRLILDNGLEYLDVRTLDPFDSSDAQNMWNPTNRIRNLDEITFSEINKLLY